VSNRFEGKRVLCTGAASGIGRATAKRFASEGGRVAAIDRDADGLAATVAAINEAGGTAKAYHCDVSKAAEVESMVAAVAADLGGIDVVLNIAGLGHFANSHEETVEGWEETIATNLTGSFLVSRFALPHLLESKGNIVNTASNAGIQGQPWSAAYCASKGGIVMLTKALAFEYLDQGVRVNAIAPGPTNTNIMHSFANTLPAGANFKKMAKTMTPMGTAEPEDLAAGFAFVASDEARFMSGSIVPIDTGVTA
jgi:NAD(P)-dependent dehydrogenase (short-subunit alcohol dehydrogenase family)